MEYVSGVTEAPVLTLSASDDPELIAAHVSWRDGNEALPTQCDIADGYMIYLLRRDLASHPYWVDGSSSPMETIRKGQFLLLDLRAQHSALVSGHVDCVSVYTPSDALQRFQLEHDLPSSGLLCAPHGEIYDDGVIRSLGESLLPAIRHPDVSQLYVSYVAMALLSRLTTRHGTTTPPTLRMRGGLAAWQERRAKEMLVANLDGRIGLEELASACRLSRSHFARAFKITTGTSPLRWLSSYRIGRAKDMLLHSDHSLEQIAHACGFSDVSHLVRSFSRAAGVPPGAWRRLRRS